MLSGYTKYKEITLPATTDDEADITVEVNVSYEASMQSEFQDIRFTETDDTQLDQQRIDYTASTTAKWFFNVASKPAAGKTLRMQYGNPTASLLSTNIAKWYWKGELDKNIEVTGNNCDIGDTVATIDVTGAVGGNLYTVDSVSTWHSTTLITLQVNEYVKYRTIGMLPYYYNGTPCGPFSISVTNSPNQTNSLTYGTGWQKITWDSTLPNLAVIQLALKRNTLDDCRAYVNGGLQASHSGDSCNNSNNNVVGVNVQSGPGLGQSVTYIYGIEVFNLPQYVIDDWEIEPGPEIEVVLGDVSGVTEITPVEEITDTDSSNHYSVSSEVNKILKGVIRLADINWKLTGAVNGWENKQPYFVEASVNGGNALSTLETSVFVMIKNTGRTYSDSSDYGIALNKALKITYDGEFVSLLTTKEPFYMKDNNGSLDTTLLDVETTELDGSTISSGSGLAVEFLALEAI